MKVVFSGATAYNSEKKTFVKVNDNDILDNIPVEISSLNDSFREMVEAEIKKEKATMLTKSIGDTNN